jgi:hypothetical protein
MQGAKVGGGQAALQGFGEGRGLADSAQQALTQGAIGAALGGGLAGAGALATRAGRAEAAAGAKAVGEAGKAAGRKGLGTVGSLAAKLDDADPSIKALAVAGLSAKLGPLAVGILPAAKALRRFAPKVADSMSMEDFVAGLADDIGDVAPQASGIPFARPPRAPADVPPAGAVADDLGGMSTREIDSLAASFEGGTAGPQTRSSVGAVGPSGVDPEAVRAQIAAIKAGTPIPTGGIQQRTAAGRQAMPRQPAATAQVQGIPQSVGTVEIPGMNQQVGTVTQAPSLADWRASFRTVPEARPLPPSRKLNADEMTALVRAKAIELGTTDAATISNAAGISSSAASQALQRLAKTFSFRDAVEKARLSRGGASAPAPAPAAPQPSRMTTQEMSALVGRPMPPGSSTVPTMAPAAPATMPPPPPELVEFFLMKGATRDQALAQAYAVMAKSFATPQGAVGRQRSAAPFSGEKPAKIATPKGRNRASAPFKKKANR